LALSPRGRRHSLVSDDAALPATGRRRLGERHRAARPDAAVASGLRRAQVGRDVDLVDLLRRAEAPRVLEIDARAQEEIEAVGIDVLVLLHEAHDPDRLGERLRLLVRAVAR